MLLRSGNAPVEDPGWPGEILLDISTPAHRRTVELHNLDSWTRSDREPAERR